MLLVFQKRDSGAGEVVVDGDGKNINGETEFEIINQYDSVMLQYDGTEWVKL